MKFSMRGQEKSDFLIQVTASIFLSISELPDLVGEEIVDSYNKLTSETPGSFVGICSDG